MASFLERYHAGEHVAVWNDLMSLGAGVRHELYLEDAAAVATETMRRVRFNVEELIQRLDAKGYRFLDKVSSAQDRLSQLDVIGQLAAQMEARASTLTPGGFNTHTLKMMEQLKSMRSNMAPMLDRAAAKATREAKARRKPPLEDPNVFCPPDQKTARQLAKLEKAAGGALPLSLRAWYEQVGGVSLLGSHPVLNATDFSNRGVLSQFESMMRQGPAATPPAQGGEDVLPDPLVVMPLAELLQEVEFSDEGEEGDGHQLNLTIAPDALHKANISGDAYYITLPDNRADFPFDDWQHTTFVNYLRGAFQWGGFPGWQRSQNPPRKELAELSEGLVPF